MSNPSLVTPFDTHEIRQRLAARIDALAPRDRERHKVGVLLEDEAYLGWLTMLTGKEAAAVRGVGQDWIGAEAFHATFADDLARLDEELPGVAGDLRLHSFSVYALTRCIQPALVVETGVASGKSSTAILLALEHNGKGDLFSFDLPNPQSALLEDGAKTSTRDRPVGWLVPASLRHRWQLYLGDSLQEMARLGNLLAPCELFFHDSLHTVEHVMRELELVSKVSKALRMVMVDDLDTGAGEALEHYLGARKLRGASFRNFGVANLSLASPAATPAK